MTNERVFTTKDIFSKGKQHLLQHYDRISDAPNAIPRLRRFILDLAVKGKLLKQNPDDESASELFERLRAEKKRLIQEGKNGKQEQLCLIEEEETPFKIPSNWIWVRLKNITSYIQRGKSPKYSTDGGLPVVSQRCV